MVPSTTAQGAVYDGDDPPMVAPEGRALRRLLRCPASLAEAEEDVSVPEASAGLDRIFASREDDAVDMTASDAGAA